MCTKLHIKVKSVDPAGVKSAFVPCGKCEDCRNSMRSSWVFRLRYDLGKLTEKGWKIGFFTLTYDNQHLPIIPQVFFKNPDQYTPTPCFKKSDIRTFFIKLKKWALKKYGCRYDKSTGEDTRLRYMCCSEFGESTRRPHYHGIICFPPCIPETEIFQKIHHLWIYGFVFPRDFNGGLDRHGYHHKPFICESVKAASLYAAKYCCKDIAYYESIQDIDLCKRINVYRRDIEQKVLAFLDCDLWRDEYELEYLPTLVRKVHLEGPCLVLRLSDYMTFHYQSKSLGASFVHDFSDEQTLAFMRSGYSFVGDDKLSPLPVYIRNKILFDPDYIIDEKTGKRLVRRKARKFFLENAESIFKAKVDRIAEQLEQWSKRDFWTNIGATDEEIALLGLGESCILDVADKRYIAGQYLAYYGVPYNECYSLSPAIQWLRRYTDRIDVSNVPRISSRWYELIHYGFYSLFNLFRKYDFEISQQKQKRAREVASVSDFWKSQT